MAHFTDQQRERLNVGCKRIFIGKEDVQTVLDSIDTSDFPPWPEQ